MEKNRPMLYHNIYDVTYKGTCICDEHPVPVVPKQFEPVLLSFPHRISL